MLRKMGMDLAAFYRSSYRIADAKSCIDAVAPVFLRPDAQREKCDWLRFRIAKAKILIDMGDYPAALKLADELIDEFTEDELERKNGKVGVWDALIDPLSETMEDAQIATMRLTFIVYLDLEYQYGNFCFSF